MYNFSFTSKSVDGKKRKGTDFLSKAAPFPYVESCVSKL